MLVLGPMSAVLVVPVVSGGLAWNAENEAVAEQDGSGGFEVGVDFVELGMSDTTRGPDTRLDTI